MALNKEDCNKVVNSIRLAMGRQETRLLNEPELPKNPTIQIDGETRRLNDGKKGQRERKQRVKKIRRDYRKNRWKIRKETRQKP